MFRRSATWGAVCGRIGLGLCGAAAVGGLLAGCTNENTALSDVNEDEEIQAGLDEAFDGTLTSTETACLTESITSHEDVTVGQIEDFGNNPTSSGPVFDVYKEAFQQCIDPNAVVTPKLPQGEVREAIVDGLRTAVPSATDEQLTCVIDQLYAAGIGVRELALVGYFPDVEASQQAAFESAGSVCLS